MPFVHVELIEGRTDEQKRKMAEEIVEAIEKHGKANRESIHVIFEDMASNDYYPGSKMEEKKSDN